MCVSVSVCVRVRGGIMCVSMYVSRVCNQMKIRLAYLAYEGGCYCEKSKV